jgi:hypothetical protein
MRKLTASFASTAVAAGAAIGTAVTTGQPASAAPAQPSTGDLVQNFMVANNLLKFEHAAYWHVEDGQMVFAKDPAWTAAPAHHSTVTWTPPAPVQHQAVASSSNSSASGGVWAELRQCESGGNYSTNTGNGYGGAYQFSQSTWSAIGMSGSPSSASPAQQDAAQRLQAQSGWSQWPACSAKLGLR